LLYKQVLDILATTKFFSPNAAISPNAGLLTSLSKQQFILNLSSIIPLTSVSAHPDKLSVADKTLPLE